MARFKILKHVGQGTFGDVYYARERSTGETVALKRVRVSRRQSPNGYPTRVLREILAMQDLQHPNVLRLRETYQHHAACYLVLDYMATDLDNIFKEAKARKKVFTPQETKCILKMILKSLECCHEHEIMHRDVKPSNFLMCGKTGDIKLCDFGQARRFSESLEEREHSLQVSTRWYKAPEILYGSKKYGPEIDIFAAASIFAELLNGEVLFKGNSDIDQLSKIHTILGTPTDETWPERATMPDWGKIIFYDLPAQSFADLFPKSSSEARDLLQKMLSYSATERLSATDALAHPYFKPSDDDISPSSLIKLIPSHSLEYLSPDESSNANGGDSDSSESQTEDMFFDELSSADSSSDDEFF